MSQQEIQKQLATVYDDYRSQHMKNTVDALDKYPGGREKVAKGLRKLIDAFPKNLDTLSKATLLYDVLTGEIVYNHAQLNTHKTPYTFLDGLFRNQGVCMGIAELYTVLATGLGLECMHVVGYADDTVAAGGGLHAWNMLLLDDKKWYFLDPTFDLHQSPGPRRNWFLKSQDEMFGHYLDQRTLRENLNGWQSGAHPLADHSWQLPLPNHPRTSELRTLFRNIRA